MKKNIFLSVIFIITTISAYANDSAGSTAAGGITFTKMPNISMEREELTISPTLVKVAYLFKNNSDKDITTQVLFPLPPYQAKGANASWDSEAEPIGNYSPFVNFSVTVQGQPVTYNTITHAVVDNKDVTEKLKQAGIPLNPNIVAGKTMLNDSTQLTNWQTKAKALRLLDANGKPQWQKQVAFYWTQTFPAHQVLLVEHQYRPSAGMLYSPMEPGKNTNDLINETMERIKSLLGIDINSLQNNSALKDWLAQQITQSSANSSIYAYFYNVDYILTTGANWGGPIKNFTLNIVKPPSGEVAYNDFYGEAEVLKKNDPDKLTFFIQNFVPKKDLKILFATKSIPTIQEKPSPAKEKPNSAK